MFSAVFCKAVTLLMALVLAKLTHTSAVTCVPITLKEINIGYTMKRRGIRDII